MSDDQGPIPPHEEPTTPGIGSRAEMKAEERRLDAPSGKATGLFQTRYREVTISAIIFGVIVGAVMNAAITYAGLKIGFTIVGSAIAAVLGFGVLRGVLRRGTILEVNIGQTIGSAVNTPNSGVIFTVPVLFLIGIPLVEGKTPNTNFWLLTLACVTGAILGGAFIVPLRKQMLDIERLRFPSATAVGAILKSPGAGAKKSVILLIGIIVSALLAAPHQLYAIESLASLDELDELVYNEKISFEDKIRTEMIASWIDQESAPEAVYAHGRLQNELKLARADLQASRATGIDPKQVDAVEALKDRVAEAKVSALRSINDEYAVGAHTINGYKDELARRALAASEGSAEWGDLRSKKADWAGKPMFGYSDLNVRAGREVDDTAGTVDYAYNGLGTEDEVLTREVDRDGNGRPDLLIDNTNIDAGRILGFPPHAQLLFALAPFALGAGYLTGRAGLFVLAGGVLAYLVINPFLYSMGWMPDTISSDQAPGFGYGGINRPLGIGLLLGGALMGVIASAPAIKEALKSIASAGGGKAAKDELGIGVLIAAVIVSALFLYGAAYYVGGRAVNTTDPVSQRVLIDVGATHETTTGYTLGFETEASRDIFVNEWDDAQRLAYLETIKASRPGILKKFGLGRPMRALIIALIGAGWIWFAGIIISQCTGMTDWSPISGMALITVVLVMVLAGVGDQLGAVMIGAALCVAITCAADMMADLKTGYIVGAQPKRQQTFELISTGIGPVISMMVLLLIAAANIEKFGIAMGPGTDTTAPQAQALQAIITGVRGESMPYMLYGLGALAGALLGLGSFSGLGVLVGLSMYLPMNYIATYGVGCIINICIAKWKGRGWAEEWGVPLAAGFIVGDALLGLSVNFVVLLQS